MRVAGSTYQNDMQDEHEQTQAEGILLVNVVCALAIGGAYESR